MKVQSRNTSEIRRVYCPGNRENGKLQPDYNIKVGCPACYDWGQRLSILVS